MSAAPRRREDAYVPFNNRPMERGSRTNKVMPVNVPVNDDGFEDADEFFNSPAPASTSARLRKSSSRNGGRTSRASRDSIGESSSSPVDARHARPSRRSGRMSQLAEEHVSDDMDTEDLLAEEGFDDRRTPPGPSFPSSPNPPPSVQLPNRSRLPFRSPSTGFDTIPSPSVRRTPRADIRHNQGTDANRRSTMKPTTPRPRSVKTQSISPADVTAATAHVEEDMSMEDDNDRLHESTTKTSHQLRDPRGRETDFRVSRVEVEVEETEIDEDVPGPFNAPEPEEEDMPPMEYPEPEMEDHDIDDPEQEAEDSEQEAEEAEDEQHVEDPEPEVEDTQPIAGHRKSDKTRKFVAAVSEDEEDNVVQDSYQGGSDDDIGGGTGFEPAGDYGEENDATMEDDIDVDDAATVTDDANISLEHAAVVAEDEEPDSPPRRAPPPAKKKARQRKERSTTPAMREERKRRAKSTSVAPEPKRSRISQLPMAEGQGQYEGDFQVRRSGRRHMKPLDWWRGEHVTYTRGQYQADIAEVVRIPADAAMPLAKKARKGRSDRGRSRSVARENEDSPPLEEGWDDNSNPLAVVMEYASGREIKRRVAFPKVLFDPKETDGGFGYQKFFGEDAFIAAGIIEIEIGMSKPSKQSRDNAYAFLVISGAVSVKIHRDIKIVSAGSAFFVPRGNVYEIENVSPHSVARLFFAQARKMVQGEEEEEVRRNRIVAPIENNEAAGDESDSEDAE